MIVETALQELRKSAAPALGKGQILLMGGGAVEDLASSLRLLAAQAYSQRKPLLFVPHAWPRELFEEYAQNMAACLVATGLPLESFRCATQLEEFDASALVKFSAILLGGGNTFDLLQALRTSGWDKTLPVYLREGGTIAGNSAGAIVLGRDIRHAHDPNETGMKDFDGLDLLGGAVIWCHDHPGIHDPEIAALRREHAFPILALSDRSGLFLTKDRMQAMEVAGIRLV